MGRREGAAAGTTPASTGASALRLRWPRLALALVVLFCAGSARANLGEARARVQLEVALAGAAPGSDGLGYFVPEISRALVDALRRGGVAVPGPNEIAPPAPLVAVSVEEHAGDRVTIVAKARGKRVEVDGAVERIAELVDQLVERLLPICLEGTVVTPPPVSAHGARPTVVAKTGAKPEPKGPPDPAPKSTRPEAGKDAKAEPGAKPEAKPEAKPDAKADAKVDPKPAEPRPEPAVAGTPTAPSPARPPLVATPAPTAPSTPPVTPTPPPAGTVSRPASPPLDPYGPDARVAEPSPAPLTAGAGYVRGRVVVHTIPEPAGAYPGAGTTATQALYAVLQRRLRSSVVPMGVGVTTLAAAAEEGQRAQARVVVMARVDAFSLSVDPNAGTTVASAGPTGGMVARMRLELAVVRDGRVVYRRALLAETPASYDRRGRADPVYLAVTHALESVLGELSGALGDVR